MQKMSCLPASSAQGQATIRKTEEQCQHLGWGWGTGGLSGILLWHISVHRSYEGREVMRQGGDGRRPCGAFSEVTLRLPIDRAQCQSLADLGLQQVALIEAVHSILFIVDAVGDVFQVLQVRPD